MSLLFSSRPARGKIPSSLSRFVASYPWQLGGLLFFTFSLALLALYLPQAIAHTIDRFAKTRGHFNFQDLHLEWLLGVIVLMCLFSFIQTLFSAFVSECVAFDLRTALIRRVAYQSASFVDKETPAKLLTKFTSDVDAVKRVITGGVVSLLTAVFMLFGSLFMLFLLSPSLTWLIASCVPLLIGVFSFVIFRLRVLFRQNQENLEKVNSHVSQSVAAASLIRVLHAGSRQVKDFGDLNERTWQLALTIVKNFAALIPLVALIMNIMTLLILWFGGQEVMHGELSIGQFSAFLSYTGLILLPIFLLAGATGVLTQSFVSFKRVVEVLDAPFAKPTGLYVAPVRGHFQLKDVSLTLGEGVEAKEVLKNINADLPAGAHVAIVGPVGAGKTQLFNLLSGLSTPSVGQVILDGVELDDWELKNFLNQLGIVFQDSILFSGTIRANLGSDKLSEEEMRIALETAQLADFVDSLPDGLDTVLAERGQDLSGGQRQRLMLARAIVRKPRLLFLDDFTARLDVKTADRVVRGLKTHYPTTMILEIAQNLRIATQADWVLLMMEGELLAQGRHEDLLATSWEYQQLFAGSQGIKDEGL